MTRSLEDLRTSVRTRRRKYWRAATNGIELLRKRSWPDCAPASEEPGRVVAITVSYNTVDLTRQLLYSLFATGVVDALDELIVVDNRSRDGSLDYLRAMSRRGLITLIENRWPPYHGPGLNRAMSRLARRPDACTIEYVWILDSDVVVLRPDALADALRVARTTGAAIVGAKLYSMVIDPRTVWRRGLPPFEEQGHPADALRKLVVESGGLTVDHPFADDGYLLHHRAGSMLSVRNMGLKHNATAEWIAERALRGQPVELPDAFPGAGDPDSAYARFQREFDAAVGGSAPEAFAADLHAMLVDPSTA